MMKIKFIESTVETILKNYNIYVTNPLKKNKNKIIS